MAYRVPRFELESNLIASVEQEHDPKRPGVDDYTHEAYEQGSRSRFDEISHAMEEHVKSGGQKGLRPRLDPCALLTAEFGHEFVTGIRHATDREFYEDMQPIIHSSAAAKLLQRTILATLMLPCDPERFLLSSLVPVENVDNCDDGMQLNGLFDDFESLDVCEGEPIPWAQMGTDSLVLPKAKKGGRAIGFTREMMCKHGAALDTYNVANRLALGQQLWREKKLMDIHIGAVDVYNRSDTLWATYYELGTDIAEFGNGGPWVNAQQNVFCSLQSLELSGRLGRQMTDLMTGKKCSKSYNTVITSAETALDINVQQGAIRVEGAACTTADTGAPLTATQFHVDPDSLTTAGRQTVYDYERQVDSLVEAYGITDAQARDWWWNGDPAQAYRWYSNWGQTVERLPLGTNEVNRHIAMALQVSERGFGAVLDPQYAVWNTH
jgi:hypothetical protein